jgi:predicted porin
MNKKLIATALLAASASSTAIAQTANPVVLYGRIYVMFENVKADGGTAAPVPSRNRVSNIGASLIGFRGTEDLGGGLKTFWQMETEFRPDANNLANFGNRNSGIGLQGDFGSLMMGRWDTPYKNAGVKYDQFNNTTLAGYTAIMADRGNFSRREQNVVQYWAPDFKGVQIRTSYTTNEAKTATANPSVVSFSAGYDEGPFSITYAYEKHKDIFKNYTGNAANLAGTEEIGQMLGGRVKFGAFTVGALLERFKKNGGGTTITSDQRSQMFNLSYEVGKGEYVFQMQRSKDGATRANAAAAFAEPDSKVTSVGYFYRASRRTTMVVLYTMTKNNRFGLGNFGANDLSAVADQDPRGFAIGMRHTF